MQRLVQATFLCAFLFPSLALAGNPNDCEFPQSTCPELVRTIYCEEERADLMEMVKVHFVDKDKQEGVSDDEFCGQLAAALEGETEADTCPGGPNCELPDPQETSEPEEFNRSGLGRTDVQAVTSYVERPVTPAPRSNGGFFNNPFGRGLLVGGLFGIIGGYLLGRNNDGGGSQAPGYLPPYNPYGPYGRPPFQPPGIAGPMNPPWMIQQPGNPFQYPFSGMPGGGPGFPGGGQGYPGGGQGFPGGGQGFPGGGYNMGINYGQMPGGFQQGPGYYYPSQGDSYFGSLPAYFYNGSTGGYPSGQGYNPYVVTPPPILPYPTTAR